MLIDATFFSNSYIHLVVIISVWVLIDTDSGTFYLAPGNLFEINTEKPMDNTYNLNFYPVYISSLLRYEQRC